MTAQIKDRNADKLGTGDSPWPTLLTFPVYGLATIFGGAMVAVDDGGNAHPASAVAAYRIWGICDKKVINTGVNGAAQVQVRPGVFYMNNSAGGEAIHGYNVGENAYVVDDNTVSLSSLSGTRPVAGVIYGVKTTAAGTLVAVGLGFPSPYNNLVNFPKIDKIVMTLSDLQALGPTSSEFVDGPSFAAGAIFLGIECEIVTNLSGGSLSAATLNCTTDDVLGAGDRMGNIDLFSPGYPKQTNPGSNPFLSIGGQSLRTSISLTGETFDNLEHGEFVIRVATVVPIFS